MRLKVIDYDVMRVAFDEKFKQTYQLIQNGETHLDNLAEGFHEADSVIFALPTIEAEPVKHGRWEKVEGSSGWEQHRCSVCKKEAIFKYEYIDDYDEGVDGEWEYIGQRENGITEYLTDYCPHCGAKMDGGA